MHGSMMVPYDLVGLGWNILLYTPVDAVVLTLQGSEMLTRAHDTRAPSSPWAPSQQHPRYGAMMAGKALVMSH